MGLFLLTDLSAGNVFGKKKAYLFIKILKSILEANKKIELLRG